MSEDAEIANFEELHPHPDEVGKSSLFRFSAFSQREEYLRHLFIDGKLYHPLPCELNDPFEAKPYFRWPDDPHKVKEMRDYLVRVAKREGHSKKNAEKIIAQGFKNPESLKQAIAQSTNKTFRDNRICSFTGSKENLLFWAHYAGSHRGFCVEYDATVLPIKYAFKVNYSNIYPRARYPAPADKRMLEPLLTKSNDWKYEDEYRLILNPSAKMQPANDGKSLILSGQEIKNIYFGALSGPLNIEKLQRLLKKGPFKPNFWQAKLSQSEFRVEFEPLATHSA